ncbi:hypothetical protein FRAHR75_10093 [Frankia sp. Hr75.2]|nr:hypothetical protein FRAHR75_10093 [Frankia sp. Hr75.2]
MTALVRHPVPGLVSDGRALVAWRQAPGVGYPARASDSCDRDGPVNRAGTRFTGPFGVCVGRRHRPPSPSAAVSRRRVRT